MGRGFHYLNIAQFLGALNDHIFRALTIYLIVHLQGDVYASSIVAKAGMIFVLPFLFFLGPSGILADRHSKRTIIVIAKGLEVVAMCVGVFAFYQESVLGSYAVLFIMAFQSALFSPAKYGIVPEIVKRPYVLRANGLLVVLTYAAIIIGTFLAAFLARMTEGHFGLAGVSCAILSFVGFYFSLKIPLTPRVNCLSTSKRINWLIFNDIYRTLRRMKKTRHLLMCALASAYFLFIGAFVQQNLLPFTIQSLGLPAPISGYIFLSTAVGIGIGSRLVSTRSSVGRELRWVPLSGMGIALGLVLLKIFATSVTGVVIVLAFLGICGGAFVVPLETFVQVNSPDEFRGQNLAAAGFLSFIGVLAASGIILFLNSVVELHASTSYVLIGLLTFGVCLLFRRRLNRPLESGAGS
jgi:acyl-[acyl-carrier-protein]-phospholipid O-acyltransferase/long-chain-fatty-acid--[acyl-carrier-protein] ligase